SEHSGGPSGRRRVALLVDDGLSPFEFSVACEVFGYDRSHLGAPWYELSVCAPQRGLVATQVGFSIQVEEGLDRLVAAHTVIVPPIEPVGGGGAVGGAGRGPVLAALAEAHKRGARIASLCTGAFLLAEAGLLDGRRATTHWSSAERLAREHPSVEVDPRVLYIDDGDILTSAGSAASIDLCLHIVRTDFGAEIANAVARTLVVPPHRDGGQAQFVDTPFPQCDIGDPLAAALEWAQQHLQTALSVEALAEQAAMSPRTLARRFREVTGTTPHRWISRQRVLLAQRLLESTDFTVDHIADLCGMGTAANLRLHFDAVVGVSPGSYRRTFCGEAEARPA
ncbi:MAG: GlxA family transcriptional regulator, partial [Solirubrobacteraceae bacterium]